MSAETIRGKACYSFSDNESIAAARDIVFSMAKRDALEGYSVFVESSSTVENFALKNDLIASITAGFLKNIKVVNQSEDLRKREVCKSITAEVDEIAIKQNIVAKVNIFRRERMNFPTGLPENRYIKVLKMEGSYTKTNFFMSITAICKKYNPFVKVRVTFYDSNGIPSGSRKKSARCSDVGDIVVFSLPLGDGSANFKIDLP